MANWYDNVTAPTDSNGRIVPLDTRALVFDGETRDVLRIAYSVSIGRWVADLANTDEHPFLTHCSLPDSWERIAAELEGLSVDSSENYYVSTRCSKLADRIRKLAKMEGTR